MHHKVPRNPRIVSLDCREQAVPTIVVYWRHCRLWYASGVIAPRSMLGKQNNSGSAAARDDALHTHLKGLWFGLPLLSAASYLLAELRLVMAGVCGRQR